MGSRDIEKQPLMPYAKAVKLYRAMAPEQKATYRNPNDYDSVGKFNSRHNDELRRQGKPVLVLCPICGMPNGQPGFIRFHTDDITCPLFGKPIPCPRCNR